MTRLIVPQWPTLRSVATCSSARIDGVSLLPYDSLSLGAHYEDNLQHVEKDRWRMPAAGDLPFCPVWLEQVRGTDVLTLGGGPYPSKRANASYSHTPSTVCAMMAADCLPVLFRSRGGTEVTVARAEWRGSCEGALEKTAARFADKAEGMIAWLGPAVGPQAFEMGPEIRDVFMAKNGNAHRAFRPADGKYFADIYQPARQRLANVGVGQIFGGDHCTLSEKDDFFSYRRNKTTGRMASFIWLI